jgi:hypothetical protein
MIGLSELVKFGKKVAIMEITMRHTTFVTSLALTAALALAAAPAQAQSRRSHDRGHERGGAPSARQGTAVPRRSVAPRPVAPRSYTVVRRSVAPRTYVVRGRARYAPRVVDRRVVIVGGPRFYRPYYTFRPRFSLNVGLWVGYPIAYPFYDVPYVYGAPYASASPYPVDPGYDSNVPYDSAPTYDTSVAAGEQPGGLSFTITPVNAAVFVDGVYVGTADEFGPTAQPLGLAPGQHRIEIRANGFRTMAFDADVVAGQVMPYQAVLQRY